MNKIRLFAPALLSIVFVFVCAACTPMPVTPAGESGRPAVTEQIEKRLESLGWQDYNGDAFGNARSVPDANAYRFAPAELLGAVYAVALTPEAAAKGVTCAKALQDDKELLSVQSVGVAASCTSRNAQPYPVEHALLQGGVDAKLSALIGDFGATGNGAYEYSIDVPMSAVLPSETCIDKERVAQLTIPNNTCEFLMVSGVTQILVKRREYFELSLNADVQYSSLIKVGGKVYGSNEDSRSRIFLTVDTRQLGGSEIVRDPSWRIVGWASNAVASVPEPPVGAIVVPEGALTLDSIPSSNGNALLLPSISDLFESGMDILEQKVPDVSGILENGLNRP